MVTKEQALVYNYYIDASGHKWKRNGATKVWTSARNSHRFRIPVKHGLFAYAYITEENAEQYSVLK